MTLVGREHMMTVMIIALVIMQLVSFYFIILLNGKIAKFKDLEIRQDKLIREMDDSISMYLVEMKEENDRFIQQLSTVKVEPARMASTVEEMPKEIVSTESAPVATAAVEEIRPFVPKTHASKAYGQQVKIHVDKLEPEDVLIGKAKSKQTIAPTEQKAGLQPFEQQVVDLHRAGKSADEIAKQLQKGKTEIELLIKFHA